MDHASREVAGVGDPMEGLSVEVTSLIWPPLTCTVCSTYQGKGKSPLRGLFLLCAWPDFVVHGGAPNSPPHNYRPPHVVDQGDPHVDLQGDPCVVDLQGDPCVDLQGGDSCKGDVQNVPVVVYAEGNPKIPPGTLERDDPHNHRGEA